MADNDKASPSKKAQKIATVFEDLPRCTCGNTVHKHGCPRYAMRVKFEDGKVIVVGPSKHIPRPSLTANGDKLLSSGPPTDSTFAEFSEDRERSPIPFSSNSTVVYDNGKTVEAQVSDNMTQIMLKVDGRIITFRPI